MVYTYLIVYKEGLVSGKLAQTNGSAAIRSKQARHRSHRSRGASGQPNPSPFPSLHYYLNLTVSACGKQKGGIYTLFQMCICICTWDAQVGQWCYVGPALQRMNGSNKAGLGWALTGAATVRIWETISSLITLQAGCWGLELLDMCVLVATCRTHYQ